MNTGISLKLWVWEAEIPPHWRGSQNRPFWYGWWSSSHRNEKFSFSYQKRYFKHESRLFIFSHVPKTHRTKKCGSTDLNFWIQKDFLSHGHFQTIVNSHLCGIMVVGGGVKMVKNILPKISENLKVSSSRLKRGSYSKPSSSLPFKC